MEDVTPAQEWIGEEERNDERESEEAETPVLDAEPEEENHPEEDEIRDEEADVAVVKIVVGRDKPPRQQPPPPSRRQPSPAPASAATLPRKTIITEARDYSDEDDDKETVEETVEETERKQRALAEREAKIREQVIRQMREVSTPPGTPSPFVGAQETVGVEGPNAEKDEDEEAVAVANGPGNDEVAATGEKMDAATGK
ncbi:unnamed protein product [Caenorhabditis brenneri]